MIGPAGSPAAGQGIVSTLFKPPNHQPGWYAPAVEEGLRLLGSSNDFAAIVSSGPPWTSHAVARALKRKSGLPWIADFRDAWTSIRGDRACPLGDGNWKSGWRRA